MPELPEVETIRRGLEKTIRNKVIKTVTLKRKDLRTAFPAGFSKNLEGRKIESLGRRSKYLMLTLDDDNILIIHLGMSGKILVKDKLPAKLEKHDHVAIEFAGDGALIYNDARRFGLMTIAPSKNIEKHQLFSNLGPEPFSNDFSPEYFFNILKKRETPIKQALMDAKVVVGVGNIYASESLFRSGINPKNKASTITKSKATKLVSDIREVLKEAIDSGGSTLRDYVRSDGDLGYFQHKFRVYGKTNRPCQVCSTNIKRITQQGRSTYYCPKCQK